MIVLDHMKLDFSFTLPQKFPISVQLLPLTAQNEAKYILPSSQQLLSTSRYQSLPVVRVLSKISLIHDSIWECHAGDMHRCLARLLVAMNDDIDPTLSFLMT